MAKRFAETALLITGTMMITNLRASRTVRSHGYALGHPCDVVLYESRAHLLNE